VLNLATLLEDSARTHPKREAVVSGDHRLNYAEVDRLARRVAGLLARRGIRRGDKVALSCPNVPAFPIVYYAILKTGAVVVPLNVLLKAPEIAYHLNDCGARAYLCFAGSAELPIGREGWAAHQQVARCAQFFLITDGASAEVPPGAETLENALRGGDDSFATVATAADDPAVVLYTSGTTGRPKGAQLSHANLVINALTCNRRFGSLPATHDRHLVTLPLFHSYGMTIHLNAGFAVGSTLVLLRRFEPMAVVAALQAESITYYAGVPTMWWGLLGALNDDADVEVIAKNLRIAVSGGSALPVEIIARVREKLGVTILEGYGLSETSPLATFSDPDREPRPGSIGIPVWGVELALIDAQWNPIAGHGPDVRGEIAIRGHNVMLGYHNRPEATAEVMRDGWFRTGDVAWRDEDGYYYIVDRTKDLIIRGGYNVYPRELEELLVTHPAVSLAAVIGVPHPVHGEEIKAVVIRHPDAETSADELVAWMRERVAAYKYPRLIEFVDALPMTATGKILKRELST
jgi:long-chain acyl-CoA synthetase